ncbi:CLUMA_CG000798, isoform A [Clunio marinus]|uniref:CLUMA_CG000798, isoform A n=1 Tax=Clunio marinus TaxID=568069 RepID=A0A1J1HL71_9DIPT|nr:CLUMA_CG000798, isoform A [Clunio marinus]
MEFTTSQFILQTKRGHELHLLNICIKYRSKNTIGNQRSKTVPFPGLNFSIHGFCFNPSNLCMNDVLRWIFVLLFSRKFLRFLKSFSEFLVKDLTSVCTLLRTEFLNKLKRKSKKKQSEV